ncbi:siderophore ABC transporter substrate-binding protein [Naumannella halotolerans]|uniref:siderophore ABC transporter substrate-binding protein n=1 Tax=Naumannella halotolerans TaxID=993414 RepID=UPI00370D6E1C
MRRSRSLSAIAAIAASAALLTACSSGETETPAGDSSAASTTVQVEDNFGTQTVTVPPTSVVATDNRTFETLSDWGVQLAAAPRALMPETIAYKNDESIVDLGSHQEPDLEAVVAAEPDLIINGQRFSQYREDLATLAPDAAIVELDPRDGEPFEAELKRQTTALGQIFGKETEAEQLNTGLDDAIARAQAAYDSGETVMAVNSTGGELGYLAPGNGRTLGPVFDTLSLTPSLELEGSDFHEGDDISVEAIAESNPDWILVMDRDAAVGSDEADYQPAAQVIEESQALQNVTAVQEGNIVYMPDDTYTNEGIQTYTEFYSSLADAFEAKG